MTASTPRSLYDLLPAFDRDRDERAGGALRALLSLMDAELATVEADARQWYENWFVETCEPWITSYLGDLVDVRPIHPIATGGGRPRTYVANAIRNRRRKGTLAGLEQACADVSGWPVRAVEAFPRLVGSADVRYAGRLRPATPDLREGSLLDRIGTAFDDVLRSNDVRSIARGRGRYALPNVALFVHHGDALPIQRQRALPAYDYEIEDPSGLFRFDLFGHDRALYGPRRPVEVGAVIPGEHVLPCPIRRRALHDDLERYRARLAAGGPGEVAPPDNLPADRPAFQIFVDGDASAFPAERLVVADLSRWQRPPIASDGQPWTLAVDPELGRIAFPADRTVKDLHVSYHVPRCGFVGGGYDPRDVPLVPNDEHARFAARASELGFDEPYAKVYVVRTVPDPIADGTGPTVFQDLESAIAHARAENEPSVLFELRDSEPYVVSAPVDGMPVELEVPGSARWGIRAANDPDARAATLLTPTPWNVRLHEGARLELGGVAVRGGRLVLLGTESDTALKIEDCTFEPKTDPESESFGDASVTLEDESSTVTVLVRRCVVGPLIVRGIDTTLIVEDSIVDAVDGQFSIYAMRASFSRVTAFAEVVASKLDVASNCIFAAGFLSCRSRRTCIRFSYLGTQSLAPSAHRCQPEGALAGVPEERAGAVLARVRPIFVSRVFGAPGYGRLATTCVDEIRRGADDESEMGVFGPTFAPQREDNLRTALVEQLRFGLEAGFVFVS